MKLKRLIVQGFKSFKDKNIINFEDGVTGIVGPNGCGKSNIVDAMFWVMGEQSAKHLRGTSMKDVIFAGSSKYAPAVWAEVSLVLSNEEGKHIHIGEKVSKPVEIQLTRKLYRNGESEYRINNIPGRLKDIQEVFMDTGAGAKSYSVIAQGEINRLVQAKPQERRLMIEEVAGITKFKLRKKESLKKIEQATANLGRLNDLKTEIHKNLSQLEKQAEKAIKAKALKEKVENNELIVFSHKEYEYLKSYREGKYYLQDKVLEIEAKATQKNSIEISLEKERNKKTELMENIEILQKEYGEISKKLAASEERLNYLKKSKQEKSVLIETKQKESKDFEKELAERVQKLQALQNEAEQLELQGKENEDFEDLEEKVEILKEEIENKEQSVSEIKREIQKEQEKFKGLEHQWLKNTSKAEEFANNLQQITLEIENLEKEFSNIAGDLSTKKSMAEESRKIVEDLNMKISFLKDEIYVLNIKSKDLESFFGLKSKECIQIESRLTSLKEIQDSDQDDGYDGNAKFIKTAQGENYKILGNMIECDEKYTQGLQNLFSENLKSLINFEHSSDDLLNWYKNNQDKGLKFAFLKENIEIDEDQIISELRACGLEQIIPCREIIRINRDDFNEGIFELLKGSFLVSNLDEGFIQKIPNGLKFKGLASFDGKFILQKENGVFVWNFLGNHSKTQGIISRNNLIAELGKKFEEMQKELHLIEIDKNEIKNNLEGKKIEYDQFLHKLTEAKSDYAASKSFIESREHNYTSYKNRLEGLQTRKIEVSKSRLKILESEEVLVNNLDEIKETIESKTEQMEEMVQYLDMQKDNFNDEKENFIKKQTEAKNYTYRVENTKKQISDFELQIQKQESRLLTNIEFIKEYNLEIENISLGVEYLEKSNQEISKNLSGREEELSHKKDELTQILSGMESREKEVQLLANKMNSLEKEVALKKVKLEQILVEEEQCVKNILEKYKSNLREIVGNHLSYEEDVLNSFMDISPIIKEILEQDGEAVKKDFIFNKKRDKELNEVSQKLKKFKSELTELGEINWAAIIEFEKQKKRYDFLYEQEEELKKSLEDLKQAIVHIDEKSKVRFSDAFAEVNMRFEKVFPVLFGGGTARLQLVEDTEHPELGVDIIAQPPGKKMQNINLMSGGEKAMTAVSLIFSIFLVKPSPFCLLDEVDAPLDDANVGRFNELLREMSQNSQFILITHNKKTMELNDVLYGVTMQEPGVSKAVSVQLH